ncbi:MAG: hypothetical protein JST84_06090 [Acidobacteria bacterium]|nr:hypothetical protein [Acidobacteriota bacterium]
MNFSAPWMQARLANFNKQQAILRLLICVGVYALLVAWAWKWPYTGDGDSMLHYWNLRVTWLDPKLGMTSWARPLYVLLMVVPAQFGWFAARCFAAFVTTILVWQTMRLADDLKMRNATLAGLMLVFQPLAFALASDTMTEIPMALGLAIALRLWGAKRFLASCLLMSFLPLARPEGFLLAPVWGLFLLALPRDSQHPSWPQRVLIGASLATGVVTLLIVCKLVTGQWLYFVYEWSWPLMGTQKGSLWHHVIYWPYYCGWILLPLFLLGLLRSIRPAMALPWAAWATVFMAHSYMFWTGTFGALGFMRILVSTAPVTALICLYGWNGLAHVVRAKHWPIILQRAAAASVMIAAALTAMVYYSVEPKHYRFVVAQKAAGFIQENHLLTGAPRLFAADPMILVELGIPAREVLLVVRDPKKPPYEVGFLVRNYFEREESVSQIKTLPSGAVGAWDNDQGRWWHLIQPHEFPALGYEVLFQAQQKETDFQPHFPDWVKCYLIEPFISMKYGIPEQEYVVVRKN